MIERVFPQLVGALDDAEEPAVDPGEVGQVRRIQVGCDLEDHLRREVWKRLFWKKYLVTNLQSVIIYGRRFLNNKVQSVSLRDRDKLILITD